ncbi:MAG: NusG domain II-containing protein [Acetobacterium sp.]
MKKKELLIIAILLVISLGGIALFYGLNATDQPLSVRVSRAGEVLATYPLSQDHTETFTDASGYNTLVISDGQARMTVADCPDQICVKARGISAPGETIVCLPHKLIAEIVTGDK